MDAVPMDGATGAGYAVGGGGGGYGGGGYGANSADFITQKTDPAPTGATHFTQYTSWKGQRLNCAATAV